jgi:hypothetical protein
MEVFLHLVPAVFISFLQVMLSPVFWVVVLLVGFLHHRQAKMKEALFGAQDYMPWHNTVMSLFFGLVGGLVGSFIMVFFGISLTGAGIGYLWLVAVALLLINPRYLCFSYAGGLISIASILFGFPEVDVPQLMGLVAVLHMIEALLIFVSGHMGAVPIYTRNYRGQLVGGFNLQRFWPLPIIALTVIAQSSYSGSWFNMPDWWPLVKPAGDMENLMFLLLPVLAALGYSDVAITNSPQEKSRHSALLLAVYSISLLGLSIAASHYRQLSLIPALFAPVAHEFTIVLGQNRELKGKPIYIHPPKGIMVLETVRGSIGSQLGLDTRDIILTINGMEVNNKFQALEAMAVNGWWTEMEYRDSRTGEIRQGFIRKKVGEPLGVIFVPGPGDVANVKFNPENSFLSRIWPPKKDYQQSAP